MGTVYRIQYPPKKIQDLHGKNVEVVTAPIDVVLIPAPSDFRYRIINYDGPFASFGVYPFFLSRNPFMESQWVKDVVPAWGRDPDSKVDPLVKLPGAAAQNEISSLGARLPTVYEWEWAMFGGEEGHPYRVCEPNKYGLFDRLELEWTCTRIGSGIDIIDPMYLFQTDKFIRPDGKIVPSYWKMQTQSERYQIWKDKGDDSMMCNLEARGTLYARESGIRKDSFSRYPETTSILPFRLVYTQEWMSFLMSMGYVSRLEMS